MNAQEMRRRLARAVVAHLATIGVDGKPHIVPITFALDGEVLFFAVDHKPKKSTNLQRLRNINANPAVSVLVDHYDDDWTRLWWVRADGSARIFHEGAECERGISLLVQRYAQYRSTRPIGPVVAITIERMTGWSAS